jgi:hypothetical protein
LAIADALGGCWPEKARLAIASVFGSTSCDDQSTGINLLRDIRRVFTDRGADKLPTHILVAALLNIETSPWSEQNHGKGLTPAGLSRQLRPFDISPRTIRIDENTVKGYLRDSFADAWQRYLRGSDLVASSEEPSETSHASQNSVCEERSGVSDPSHHSNVTSCVSPSWAELERGVTDVTSENPNRGFDSPTTRQIGGNGRDTHFCGIHPSNVTNWWQRAGDPMCGECHPDPSQLTRLISFDSMSDAASKGLRKSGLRRRGHLFKGLRTLANDPKATPTQRLRACEMLFALETNPDHGTAAQPAKLNGDSKFPISLSDLNSNNGL